LGKYAWENAFGNHLTYNYPGINRETISSILELDVGWGRFSMAENR